VAARRLVLGLDHRRRCCGHGYSSDRSTKVESVE
jgi:hypothetical protein